MINKEMQLCPCGKNVPYRNCCGIFIENEKIPNTAEELMRSRYTAYTQANIPYILKTMYGVGKDTFDIQAAEAWTREAKWKRLKVLRVFPHNTLKDRSFVEFKAYYIWRGQMQILHEVSEFDRIDGHWYYIAYK